MQYDLSILIPARNEMFTAITVRDILLNKRGKTEVIVGMDGQWAEPGLEDHKDVRVVYVSEAIGQRAMTNRLCDLSTAKYVMKVDAHCAFDEGFDVKLMEDMQDDWTVVPIMKNLHAFNWLCPNDHRRYQGPSGPCKECGEPTEREMIWRAKDSPQSTSYRFDKTLKFQYFGEYKQRQTGDLVETMSLQGSCFMLTREKYWELNICDEAAGSWGHQGSEVALKTWLSGGKCIVNKKTWYGHMFRTQGGDFGFPWPAKESEIEKARVHFRGIFLEDKWPLAKHKLQWLIDKFSPVPDWETQKGIIFYTDNQLPLKIARQVQKQIKSIGLPITSASLKPMEHMGKNVRLKLKRGHLTMFKQILAALEACEQEIVFFCEHDVLYHPSHFDFTPPEKDRFYYNLNWWKVRADGLAVHWDAVQVSGLCCYRETAIKFYRERIAAFDADNFDRKYEPTHNGEYETWRSESPCVDIRHDNNLTYNKWKLEHFRDKSTAVNFESSTVDKIPGWDNLLYTISK